MSFRCNNVNFSRIPVIEVDDGEQISLFAMILTPSNVNTCTGTPLLRYESNNTADFVEHCTSSILHKNNQITSNKLLSVGKIRRLIHTLIQRSTDEKSNDWFCQLEEVRERLEVVVWWRDWTSSSQIFLLLHPSATTTGDNFHSRYSKMRDPAQLRLEWRKCCRNTSELLRTLD